MLVVGLLGGAVYEIGVGGGGGTGTLLLEPFIGSAGVKSRSEEW